MNTYAPTIEAEIEREDRLDVARTLYKSLAARYPDRLIILCDERARVLLAQTSGPPPCGNTSAIGN